MLCHCCQNNMLATHVDMKLMDFDIFPFDIFRLKTNVKSLVFRVGFLLEETSFFPSGWKKGFIPEETGRNWKKLEEINYI